MLDSPHDLFSKLNCYFGLWLWKPLISVHKGNNDLPHLPPLANIEQKPATVSKLEFLLFSPEILDSPHDLFSIEMLFLTVAVVAVSLRPQGIRSRSRPPPLVNREQKPAMASKLEFLLFFSWNTRFPSRPIFQLNCYFGPWLWKLSLSVHTGNKVHTPPIPSLRYTLLENCLRKAVVVSLFLLFTLFIFIP